MYLYSWFVRFSFQANQNMLKTFTQVGQVGYLLYHQRYIKCTALVPVLIRSFNCVFISSKGIG